MVDFLIISTRATKKGVEIFPKFKLYPKSKDLMIRGGDFYAIWMEDIGLWSTNEDDALAIIDRELQKFADKYIEKHPNDMVNILYTWDSSTGSVDIWHKYCQKQKRDSFETLDDHLMFANTPASKDQYASKRLNYPLEAGSITSYDKLISTLYSEEERHKIEWAIGAIVTGDSKHIQKFLVFYGSSGTGKSTIMNIVQKLFEGYWEVFDAKALGSANAQFAMESFKENPLIAIQHDGDLSKIEDNTRLNSLVSHERMTINEKFKSTYGNSIKSFLFMGTNKPVRISDSRSGLIRRLIDVSPSGNKLDVYEYDDLVGKVNFELGAIAWHCKEVYTKNKNFYNNYMPISMMGASNDFYNFMTDVYHVFKKEDATTLKAAWEMYKVYCDDAKVAYPLAMRSFKEELKNYFKEYDDQYRSDDGTKYRSYYRIFRREVFETDKGQPVKTEVVELYRLDLLEQPSLFDLESELCPAQYASTNEIPTKKWDDVDTILKNIDTKKLHYVKLPENHIVIDFDLTDENGNKSYEKNIEAASKWPSTYSELSKSGKGVHLHYKYNGDATKLSRVYADSIEIKVFTGNSSLRRKLSKCNDLPIRSISSGLPMKGEKSMISNDTIKSEKGLRQLIMRNLNKEIHPGTKPSVDFIYKILEDAYEQGLKYDLSDMKNEIYAFAAASSNQSETCLKIVSQMHFKSDSESNHIDSDNETIVFYDVEVFPNLLIVNFKKIGDENKVVRMINPPPSDIENLLKFRLVGFNCRRYDNHILYARLLGYNNLELYNVSQRIIKGEKGAYFGEAYNLSYTDIYDFASDGNKKSLKKLEIEMGITHKELGLDWDKPVPEDKWIQVAEYCDNDVIATEAAWHYLSADWTARQILADLAGMSVNSTTNSLTIKIIFGNNKEPQSAFKWRDLSKPVYELPKDQLDFMNTECSYMMNSRAINSHIDNMIKVDGLEDNGDVKFVKDKQTSILPYFDGYKYWAGKSTYKGEDVGEGGYVYAEPGIYRNVALLDVVSMHPNSLINECHFGPVFTKIFKDIVEGRVTIKHSDWDLLDTLLDGKLVKYVEKVKNGEMTSKDLANALKTAINSVYGLTAATFDNPARCKDNVDNIVAKRGALFMIDLKYEVQNKGFTVAHIKTDSIKIPDATPEIIKFVTDFGKLYGYEFEHEATYDRMCLVNDSVYIALYATENQCSKLYDYIPEDCVKSGGKWTATGTQFQIPYVFKTLFSGEPIEFKDLCETKSVTTSLHLDMNESLTNVKNEEKELKSLDTKIKKGKIDEDEYIKRVEELNAIIDTGHNYTFVGKIGNFCPILEGKGGGILVREKDGKYYAVNGSKGYRWLESELVKGINEDYIDRSYYNTLVDKAIDTINIYGDFEMFVSDIK